MAGNSLTRLPKETEPPHWAKAGQRGGLCKSIRRPWDLWYLFNLRKKNLCAFLTPMLRSTVSEQAEKDGKACQSASEK